MYVKKSFLTSVGDPGAVDGEFHQIDKIREYTTGRLFDNDPLAQVFLRMDSDYDLNERKQQTNFLDFFTSMGGLLVILFIVGWLLVNWIARLRFTAELVDYLYQVKDYSRLRFRKNEV